MCNLEEGREGGTEGGREEGGREEGGRGGSYMCKLVLHTGGMHAGPSLFTCVPHL